MRFNIDATTIPQTWQSLDDFIHWYRVNGYPFKTTLGNKTFVSDHSYSMIIFDHDVFTVEMYVGAPSLVSTKHTHPFESRTMFCGGKLKARKGTNLNSEPPFIDLQAKDAGFLGAAVLPGMWHQIVTDTGFVLLTFSKWPSREKITSAVVAYQGPPMGPKHSSIIRNDN